MKQILTALTLLCLLLHATMAQAASYRLLLNDRLTNNQINCIAQDVRGFIWIGTDYGLNRFDGQSVSQYTRSYGDPSGMSGNIVRSITPCKDGSLWIGLSNGMQRFCPRDDNFHSIEFPAGVVPNVTCIVNMQSGDVAIATSGYGLFLMKDDKKYVAKAWDAVNDITPCRYINYIKEDSQGRIWIGSHDNSVWVYDTSTGKTWRATDEKEQSDINYICEDQAGRVFVVTHSRIFSCARNEKMCHEEFVIGQGRDIASAVIDGEGRLLLTVRNEGLLMWNQQLHAIQPFEPIGMSASRLMHTLGPTCIDREQNLWLCSSALGVAQVFTSEQLFTHWARVDYESDLDGVPYCLWEDENGHINVSYGTGTVGVFDSNGHCIDRKHYGASVRSVYRDGDGSLWMGLFYAGIRHIDVRTGKVETLPYDEGHCINAMDKDTEGRLWYAAFGHGFCSLDPATGEHKRYLSADSTLGVINDWVNHLATDKKGRVWLAHWEGVSCYDPARGKCMNLAAIDSVPFSVCFCLCVQRNGTVWMGTDNGVISYNTETKALHHYTVHEGLSCDNICSIVEDRQGIIWVSTMKGLNRITPDAQQVVTTYYSGNGLGDRQYVRAAACYMTSTDMIYMGGTNGVTSFHPSRLDQQRTVPGVRLMSLFLNNQPASARTMSDGRQVMAVAVTEADEFFLGYEDNSFTMEFGVMGFLPANDVLYEYSLDKKHWNSTQTGQNRITFTHLASGTYTLSVRAVLGDNSSEVKQYTIHISAPWYATGWAWLVYIMLALALAGAAILAWMRNKKAELNESKLMFFTNISHEIRTPMTMIVSPLDKLIKRRDVDSDTHRSLVVMRQNAGRILMLMNQLLDIRKFDKGQMTLSCRKTDVAGFLDSLARLFDEQAHQRKIDFQYERPDKPVEAWIDQNHIDKVTMNLLSNAFKYTPDGGSVAMRLTTDSEKLTVTITDSGIGLDPKDKMRIFERFYRSAGADGRLGTGIGLHLSAELMRLHHGTLTADNRNDGVRGSVFCFTVPLGCDYLKPEEIASNTVSADEPVVVHDAPAEDTAEPEPQPEDTEIRVERDTPKTSKGSVRIMIVDDDEEILSYMNSELSPYYRITLCRDGQEAIAMALREQPALIVSDVMMPNMDGCTMVKRLRGNVNISHIPVILLSAKSEVEDRIAGLAQGADAYLAKPFHTDELLAMIRGLIEGRQRLRGAYSGARDQEDRVEKVEMQSSDEMLMDRLMKVVNQHLSDSEFNIEQLAQEVGLSRTHLHRKLKSLTGLSASEFLRNLRMRQAEQLLRDKRMNISQIAYAVGFANQTHFSTAFKKHSGMSPSEFIESLKD